MEPVVFTGRHGTTLLLGTPNYVYAADDESSARSPRRNTVFGALLRGMDSAELIESPVLGLPTSMRALAREDGGWDVVFAELPLGYTFPDKEHGARLWHGVLDNGAWRALHPVPLPEGILARSFDASLLVSTGDTLWWAMTFESDAGRGLALFAGVKGHWMSRRISLEDLDAVNLASSRDGELILLLVRGGWSVGQASSLFEYRWQDSLRLVREVASGGKQPVHDVRPGSSSAGRILTWSRTASTDSTTTLSAQALTGAWTDAERLVDLADDIALVRSAGTSAELPVWIVQAPRSRGSRELELRFLTQHPESGHVVTAGRMEDPFNGPFGAMSDANGDLLIAGPQLTGEGANTRLVTLLLRVRSHCSGASR